MNIAGQPVSPAPLKTALGAGASHTGVHYWWLQRLTAIALIPLSLWFLFFASALVGIDYAGVLALIANPIHALLLICLTICLYWHGAIGLQVITEDYIHSRPLEMMLKVGIRLGAAVGCLACVMAILSVWLGATLHG
ncbi:MAG: succinate dehydrogenase, hydrophobic membrane anchor protein [Nevskiaceae bacterium]|nr:MAG: succinate dehydrogenase, hydrophobic membrane anchor protein [Nevskiaceae bacterium]TBR72614.1 MAG: succinate dehydrogenase, hydrophobic membrane anchor protein [Nevskiaceae bacterium]